MKYNPPAGSQDPDAKYVTGQPGKVRGSAVPAEAVEHPQREIVEVIKKAGLDPDGDDLTQLWQAIGQIISTNAPIATKEKPGLVQIGDGLAITPEGLLSVLIASTSQAGLVKPRYGLKIGKDGSLDVDFGDMPTDKFEELLKSIRVPIWLTKNKDFYVNGTTGSDTLDEGRGESLEKAFKTIQAAINYVCDSYNIGKYICSINIMDGVYNEYIRLSKYNSTTGYIVLKGLNSSLDSVISGAIIGEESTGRWDISFLTVRNRAGEPSVGSNGYYGILSQSGSTINIIECAIDLPNAAPTGRWKFHVAVDGGTIAIRSKTDGSAGLICSAGSSSDLSGIVRAIGSGNVNMLSNIACNGLSVQNSTLVISEGSTFRITTPAGRTPPIFTGSVTGKRYDVYLNGIINTGRMGEEFVLGTIQGSSSSGGQYS